MVVAYRETAQDFNSLGPIASIPMDFEESRKLHEDGINVVSTWVEPGFPERVFYHLRPEGFKVIFGLVQTLVWRLPDLLLRPREVLTNNYQKYR